MICKIFAQIATVPEPLAKIAVDFLVIAIVMVLKDNAAYVMAQE